MYNCLNMDCESEILNRNISLYNIKTRILIDLKHVCIASLCN